MSASGKNSHREGVVISSACLPFPDSGRRFAFGSMTITSTQPHDLQFKIFGGGCGGCGEGGGGGVGGGGGGPGWVWGGGWGGKTKKKKTKKKKQKTNKHTGALADRRRGDDGRGMARITRALGRKERRHAGYGSRRESDRVIFLQRRHHEVAGLRQSGSSLCLCRLQRRATRRSDSYLGSCGRERRQRGKQDSPTPPPVSRPTSRCLTSSVVGLQGYRSGPSISQDDVAGFRPRGHVVDHRSEGSVSFPRP